MNRNRRASVEDRWTKTVKDVNGKPTRVPSAKHGQGKRWLACWVQTDGRELSKTFDRKGDARAHLDSEVSDDAGCQRYSRITARPITPGRLRSRRSALWRGWGWDRESLLR